MATLADLITKFADVVETPDGFLVHCPAHADAQQSLRLTVSDTGKVLMRCRAGCKTPDVVKALGMTMKDLATMTAGDVALTHTASAQDVPADPAAVAALAVKLEAYAAALTVSNDLSAAALAYASARFGVTADDAARLGLGVADDLGGGTRLVVPFRDANGVARGFQARALDPDATVRWLGPKSPDGANWAKVGFFPGLGGYDEVLITEGPGDALTSAASGFDAIGVRGAGLSVNPAVVDALVAIIGTRPAVVAGDGDPAGRRFTSSLAEALTAHDIPVKILRLHDGRDLTDWREEAPARFHDDLIAHVAKAEPVKSRTASLLAWDEERYSLTDLGGARYLRDFIESQGSGVRFSEEVGFFLLEDGVWRKDERQGVRTHAQAVADLVRNLAKDANFAVAGTEEEGVSIREKKRAARLNAYAAHVQSTRGIDSLIRELQAVQGVPASLDEFDKHPDLLACKNGVVNLKTGELQPHDPALLLTRRVAYNYNPDAKAPRWLSFLDEVFPAYVDQLPAYIQRLVGYGITGHTTEQCFAVLWGTGANGKSIFTDTLSEVFSELTTTTPFSTFEERASGGIPNDLAALKGARLVMAAEGEHGRPMAESVLKRVTGRDLIAARFMRKEFFEFRPTFLLMLATNFKPTFKGQDEGLWRRVKLIPWDRYFADHERDHHLGAKLLKEAEGILAWSVAGAMAWYRGGLQDPSVITHATKEYRETSDALAGFIPGVFTLDKEASRVDGRILFDAYLQWADEENLPQREVWTRRTFFGALEERGLTKRKTNKGIAFDGARRARQTDSVPDHDRAEEDLPAPFPPETPTTETPLFKGADLDEVI